MIRPMWWYRNWFKYHLPLLLPWQWIKCPCCNGEGGWTEVVDYWLGGPHYDCEFCHGTGRVGPWRRHEWWWHVERKGGR